MPRLFYQPENGFSADYIPFYDKGVFHLFFIHDMTRDGKTAMPLHHIATKDFVHFTDYGVSITAGTEEEQDFAVFNGSILHTNNEYHLFYTGQNGGFPKHGRPMQAIMHAVSKDLHNWAKHPCDTMYANTDLFDQDRFCDPFVFQLNKDEPYQMIANVQPKESGFLGGILEKYSSSNLIDWHDDGVFWAPQLYNTYECPDLFQMGQYWYLVFSENHDKMVTHYVMSESSGGPWRFPDDDQFDARAYYAAKTCTDGRHRYLVGWIGTRSDDSDTGYIQWGGNLVIYQLVQRKDGTLGCCMPESTNKAWQLRKQLDDSISVSNFSGMAENILFRKIKNTCRIDLYMSYDSEVMRFGLFINQKYEEHRGYKYEFLPFQGVIRFKAVSAGWLSGDLSRPVKLKQSHVVELSLIIEDSICILYVNNEYVLSSRIYAVNECDVSVFAIGGKLTAYNIKLYEVKGMT